jgi:phenylacetate-CoA ligase
MFNFILSLISFFLYMKRGGRKIERTYERLLDIGDDDVVRERFQDFSDLLINHPRREEILRLYSSKQLTNKNFVKKNYDLFFDGSHAHSSLQTSGTSGAGLKFPVSKRFLVNQWAVFTKQWGELNLKDEWRFQFSGLKYFKKNKIHRVDYFGRKIFLSQYHLSSETIHLYVKVLKQHDQIKWLHGYPSAILNLVELVKNTYELSVFDNILHITTSSESISDGQKTYLSEILNVSVSELYGQTEGVANFFTCREGNLHVNEAFSVVEFLPNNGRYNVIGTSLHNSAFPFVNYDTGDSVASFHVGCKCGRSSRYVVDILGRDEDYLVKSDGVKVGRLDHLSKGLSDLKRSQIVQAAPGTATFFIDVDASEASKVIEILRKRCAGYLGKGFRMTFEVTQTFELSKNGKMKYVLSKLE